VTIKLYSYWRSSAAYRVRIALNFKGLEYETVPVSLAPGVSEHRKEDYRAINPQMLVPFLDDGRVAIGQSQAILEYIEEAYQDPPLLPQSIEQCAQVRAFCNIICCDIHPLNNLRVRTYLKESLGANKDEVRVWYAHWISAGFAAAEALISDYADDGPYAFGADVTLADVCLVPQMYNAYVYDVPLDDYPRLVEVDAQCNRLPAFAAAIPEKQPDAPA